MQLKPISQQVIVVTGADAGLGLAIARKAAQAGAAVVLAGADEAAVRKASEEITAAGGRAYPVAGDASSEEGCQRIGRAAAARFDRIDGWVDAGGGETGLAHAAQGMVRHLGARGGQGALVGFGRRLAPAARAELHAGRGVLAATLIRLPRGARETGPTEAAAQAALYALTHPIGRMAVAPGGRRLSAVTEASKHRGLLMGAGVVAVAGAALWLGRGQIAKAAGKRITLTARPRHPSQPAKPPARRPRRLFGTAQPAP